MHSQIPNLLILLLVSHVLVLVSAKVFLSIDCGYTSLEPYTDENSIEWVGDQQYIQTGDIGNVLTPIEGRNIWSTFREFTTRRKNCYSLDVFNNNNTEKSSEVERVLIRASFYYGNYDKERNPPTFNLQFNGNNWSEIVTSMDRVTRADVVFSLNHGKNITVCLAQTRPDHFPFISALEVRSLDADMYSYVDSNYPLFFKLRRVFGPDQDVRFPKDSYDRFWESPGPLRNDSEYEKVRNNSPFIKMDMADKVPEALFTAAIMPKNISAPLWIGRNIEHFGVPLHFNAYFSEVLKLNSTQKRAFNITVSTINGNDTSFCWISSPFLLDIFSLFGDCC